MDLTKYKEIVAKDNQEFELFQTKFFPIVMQMEGGGKLHNVAGDSGGWTIWGVAYNYWKNLFTNFDDFRDTTREEATYIGYVNFYIPIQAKYIPYDVKLIYFDMAYNMNTVRTIKMMQECAGVTADGQIGPRTIAAMKNVTEICMKQKRDAYYNTLGRSSKFKKFLKGWLNRSRDIFNFKY